MPRQKANLVIPFLGALSISTGVAAAPALEEVVVTAQKREQSQQDIPIAIAAFSGDQLASLGTDNLQDLVEHVPGAELFDDRGAGQPTWVIRGVGLADFNSNNTPTAAIYYDEYYLTSNVLGGIGLFDLAGVEVLKGPQGGLYGRNTSGGAVQVKSRRPSLEGPEGYISASYGRWGRYGIEAAVGAPISDTSAFRLAVMTNQDGGWQDSLATAGDDDHGDQDFSAVRAQLLFQPNDEVEVLFKIDGGENKSETTLGYARAGLSPTGPGFCPEALAGKHNEDNCLTLGNVTNLLALTPGDPGVLPSAQSRSGTRVLSEPVNQLDNSWIGFTGQVNWDLGFATLTSITGYLDYTNKQIFDFDAQPFRGLQENGRADLESWSQELRLISNTDGPLSWLFGVMYAEDEVDEFRVGDLSENVLIFSSITQRGFSQETESWAVYGQGDYQLSDQLRVNGSIRYTKEDKELKNAFHFDNIGGFFYAQGVNKSYELDSHLSGHIGIDWTPTDDALIYAKVTRGFKSGGFFGGFFFSADELDPYEEEIVWSYEVGFKTEWLDSSLRINGAVFYYDYESVQGFTQVTSPVTGTALTKLGNLGDAEHHGAELDVIWLPSAIEGLTLNLGVSVLDAEISDSNTIAIDENGMLTSIEDTTRAFSPELSYSLQARYERSVFNDLVGALQLNYSWRDDISPRDSFGTDLNYGLFRHDGYGVLNGRLSLSDQDGRWQIALVGQNLTDKEYAARASGDDLGSYLEIPTRPFSWAIEVNYNWQ